MSASVGPRSPRLTLPRWRGGGRAHRRGGPSDGRSARFPAVVAALAVAIAGCAASGEPDLEIGEARASDRVGGASQVAVAITNHGDGDDTLVGATTPAAAAAEIHHTTIDDGRATMDTLDEVEIPAGETVELRPGELHLMLAVPDESVVTGGTFELTLRFERSGELTVPVQVVASDQLLEPAS